MQKALVFSAELIAESRRPLQRKSLGYRPVTQGGDLLSSGCMAS
jgi:hypothetical protein